MLNASKLLAAKERDLLRNVADAVRRRAEVVRRRRNTSSKNLSECVAAELLLVAEAIERFQCPQNDETPALKVTENLRSDRE
ncbi:MAG TPA: hypothetical protein VME66_09875 [Candidatus Acidoferrales bacterium]|nr:hypothetical protein [Candidatus Acidoferrales bacterium]